MSLEKPARFVPQAANLHLSEELHHQFSPSKIVKVLEGMLKADREFTNKSGETITSPDWAARERAIRIILEYQLGRPIQRQEIVTKNGNSHEEIIAALRQSPSTRKQILSLIEKIESELGDQT